MLNTVKDVPEREGSGAAGAVWTLPFRDRDLDSNIIALPAGGRIDAHTGPDLDVLIHILAAFLLAAIVLAAPLPVLVAGLVAITTFARAAGRRASPG